MHAEIPAAARLIHQADALLITAGAGMGVDSGLPDFRGSSGFWQAYPALGRAGIPFQSIANPAAFRDHPRLAWGFYGHRLDLYRRTRPHRGFALLQAWAARLPGGAFVVTSNVDGQFQKAGCDANEILEIHGSIHQLQCAAPCCARLWPAAPLEPRIDPEHCHWLGELPSCPHCGGLARPNILMFGDGDWVAQRQEAQRRNWDSWLAAARRPLIIECGAGIDVPSIRHLGESLPWPLLRINPREPALPAGKAGLGLALGALAALEQLDQALELLYRED